MLDMFFGQDSYFLSEGKNMLVDKFGKNYGTYFSILTLISQGENTRSELESALNIKELSGKLKIHRLIPCSTFRESASIHNLLSTLELQWLFQCPVWEYVYGNATSNQYEEQSENPMVGYAYGTEQQSQPEHWYCNYLYPHGYSLVLKEIRDIRTEFRMIHQPVIQLSVATKEQCSRKKQ